MNTPLIHTPQCCHPWSHTCLVPAAQEGGIGAGGAHAGGDPGLGPGGGGGVAGSAGPAAGIAVAAPAPNPAAAAARPASAMPCLTRFVIIINTPVIDWTLGTAVVRPD